MRKTGFLVFLQNYTYQMLLNYLYENDSGKTVNSSEQCTLKYLSNSNEAFFKNILHIHHLNEQLFLKKK